MKITFDVETLLKKLMTVGPELPSILERAASSGLSIPAIVSRGIPYIGLGAELLEKFVKLEGDAGLSKPGMPNIGRPGIGRLRYLRQKGKYNDSDVVRAVEFLTDPAIGLEGASQVDNMVKYTMSCMSPDDNSDLAARKAIDQILEMDGLSQGVCDRLGDLVYYTLDSGMTKPKKPVIEKVDTDGQQGNQ